MGILYLEATCLLPPRVFDIGPKSGIVGGRDGGGGRFGVGCALGGEQLCVRALVGCKGVADVRNLGGCAV